MSNNKELAIRALNNLCGDNLERAQHAFRGMTDAQMNEQHGFSGKTRAEILAEYEAYRAEVDAAIKWVMAQGD